MLARHYRFYPALRALRPGGGRPDDAPGGGTAGVDVPQCQMFDDIVADLRRAQADAEIRCFR